MQPGERYDNLYLSAKSRSEADWLIGINATQALSVAAGQGVFSLGRVQTCLLYTSEQPGFTPTADIVPGVASVLGAFGGLLGGGASGGDEPQDTDRQKRKKKKKRTRRIN